MIPPLFKIWGAHFRDWVAIKAVPFMMQTEDKCKVKATSGKVALLILFAVAAVQVMRRGRG
jgi:hypothetical protein